MFQYAALYRLGFLRGREIGVPAVGHDLYRAFPTLTATPLNAVTAEQLYREPQFEFNEGIWLCPDNTDIDGYFQSEQYFYHCADRIREEFRFASGIDRLATEFLKQANAAMKAVWVDQHGVRNKIQGLILWDTFKFSPKVEWEELDRKHKHYFELLQALMNAWTDEMKGIVVKTNLPTSAICQFALPEPKNSASEIKSESPSRIVEDSKVQPEKENDRVGSGRIRGNRVKE